MSSSLGLSAVAAIAAVLFASTFVVRRYLRLRHIPGPFLASLTDFWLAYKYSTGTHYANLLPELHAQYGPVVRWGPNRVSFASPDSIQEIYVNKPVFKKSESYLPLSVMAKGREVSTLISMRDEKRASSVKRHMTGGFSQASFLKQEPQIDSVLQQFLDTVKEVDSGVVHLSAMLRWWSFDTINQVAFSDDLGYMKAGADVDRVFVGSKQRFDHSKRWWALPRLERLIYKNPITSRLGLSSSILADLGMKRVQERKDDDEKSLEKDLLGRYMAASRNDPETISPLDVIGLTISTIHAGSDTTASSLALVLVNLLKNPATHTKLQAEVLAANLPVPPPFEQVANLPYLDATIRESGRVLSISPTPLQREVPAEGATICGIWIPGGVDVSPSLPDTAMSTAVYGQDAHAFRPERWLEADEQAYRVMDRSLMTFSKGQRLCVGHHLAKIEMKKMLGALLTAFDISLAEEPKIGWEYSTREIDLKVRMLRR